MKKSLLALLLFCSITIKSNAQDVTFTHFLYNPIYINPAAVGIDEGFLLGLNYRRAMITMPSTFETYAVGAGQSLYDAGIRGLGGVGLFVVKNQEGENKFNTISIGVPFSARVTLTEHFTLQLGVAPVIYQKYIEPGTLLLGDQLDRFEGLFLNNSPSLNDPLNPFSPKVSFFDFHLGMFLRWESDPTENANSRKDVFDIGLSVQHLPEPKQNFFLQASRLPAKYNIMMRYSYCLSDGFLKDGHIQPVLLFEKQATLQDFVAGVNLNGSNINVGTFIRREQSKLLKITELVLMAGIQFPIENDYFSMLHINYSFDYSLNSSGTKGLSTHEISLIFQLPSLHGNKNLRKIYF